MLVHRDQRARKERQGAQGTQGIQGEQGPAGTPLLWTATGAVLLTLLFVGSTRFTEQISLGRHREYADYQRTTSMLLPWRPRRDAR